MIVRGCACSLLSSFSTEAEVNGLRNYCGNATVVRGFIAHKKILPLVFTTPWRGRVTTGHNRQCYHSAFVSFLIVNITLHMRSSVRTATRNLQVSICTGKSGLLTCYALRDSLYDEARRWCGWSSFLLAPVDSRIFLSVARANYNALLAIKIIAYICIFRWEITVIFF